MPITSYLGKAFGGSSRPLPLVSEGLRLKDGFNQSATDFGQMDRTFTYI